VRNGGRSHLCNEPATPPVQAVRPHCANGGRVAEKFRPRHADLRRFPPHHAPNALPYLPRIEALMAPPFQSPST